MVDYNDPIDAFRRANEHRQILRVLFKHRRDRLPRLKLLLFYTMSIFSIIISDPKYRCALV